MQLPSRPTRIISLTEWEARHQEQQQQQQHPPQPRHEEHLEQDDEIRLVDPSFTTNQSLGILSRSQQILTLVLKR